MTYPLFCGFDKFTRVELTLEEGVLVGEREDEGDTYFLFRLWDFWVELGVCDSIPDEIQCIFQTDGEELLDPYLEQVDLGELLG